MSAYFCSRFWTWDFSFLVLQFVPKQKGRIETLCVLSFKDWTGYLLMFELKENLTDSTGMEY